jgi:hypothetical protein
VPGGFPLAVVASNPQAVTKLKKKYLWSWAIAGVMIPLLLLVVGVFMPKPPEWNPFQEPKISQTQQRFAVAAALLWPTELVVEVLALLVTDAGGNSSAALPSAIIIAVSLLLNAAIYVGIGFVFWTFGEQFSRFFQRRSPK